MEERLAHLILLDIAVGLLSLGGIMAVLIYMAKQLGEARASTERIAHSMERIVQMIERDLDVIKAWMRGH